MAVAAQAVADQAGAKGRPGVPILKGLLSVSRSQMTGVQTVFAVSGAG